MHTPPPPGSRATAEASNCVCAKRWIWGRGSLSLFTEQGRLSSDAKATKSCKRKLSRSTRTPRQRGVDKKEWSGSPNAGTEPAGPVCALRSTCSRSRSPPPVPVLEEWRRGKSSHTQKISRLGLHAARVKKTQRRGCSGKRAQRTGQDRSFKSLTRKSTAILRRLGRLLHPRKLCRAGRLNEPPFPVEGRADH